MVDLFFERDISSVNVVNRRDCCQERLDGLIVELLDPNDAVVATVHHDPARDGPFGDEWRAIFADNPIARKVRVSLQHPEGDCVFLNLASVQVYSSQCTAKDSCHEGLGCNYGNVALCMNTEQSSTMRPRDGPPAKSMYAVDGSLTLSHTNCETAPWWQVDLQKEREVTEIVVKNREDCCFERLDGMKIELLDDSGRLAGYFQRKNTLAVVLVVATMLLLTTLTHFLTDTAHRRPRKWTHQTHDNRPF